MSTINIDCNRAYGIVDDLKRIKKDITDVKRDVYNVRRNINASSTSMRYIKCKLSCVENDILTDAACMDTFAEALERIISHYELIENRLVSQQKPELSHDNTVSSMDSSKSADFWDKIRNILVTIGFIKAEKQSRKEGDSVTKFQEHEMDRYMQNEIASVLKRSRFSEKTWKAASVEERKRILNEYLQEVATIMGLSIGAINYTYSESENGYYNCGSYTPNTNTVSINEWVVEGNDGINSYKLLTTVVHELRHAYQHAACDNPDQYVVSDETINTWRESFNNYKSSSGFEKEGMSPSEAYNAYRNQAVEKDARKFAKQ